MFHWFWGFISWGVVCIRRLYALAALVHRVLDPCRAVLGVGEGLAGECDDQQEEGSRVLAARSTSARPSQAVPTDYQDKDEYIPLWTQYVVRRQCVSI